MKKINKKKIIIVILITILIIAIVFVVIALRNKRDVDNYSENITDENDANIINQIKAEINSTADTNIYQVEDEYDGRHTLQIKPNIQFDTVLAGVLIEGTPANNEIDSILKNKPTNTGVWISKKSRDSFKKILIDNNLTNFSIDESGYLFETEKKNNEMSKKLDNIIKSDKQFIIDISGTCYVRDEMSGDIVEYPFEKMDPNQIMELYKNDNSTILEISTNSKGKISNVDILKTIILNLE